jgi:putative aminopeptidase FrvX
MRSTETRSSRIEAWTRELCLIPGLSGYEDPVSDYIATAFAGTRAERHIDALGNLTLTVLGTDSAAPRVMVFAHTDRMGLVVRRIEADGFVRVERLGGVPDRVLPALQVVVTNQGGAAVPAVVGIKAHHATPPDEKRRVVPYEQLTSISASAALRRFAPSASTSVRRSLTGPSSEGSQAPASREPRWTTALAALC